jgi:hypothetical protein
LKQISKLKTRRKGEEKTPSDEPTVPSVHSVGVVGTLRKRQNEVGTVGEPTVHFVDALDELQRKSSEDSSTG